ncbi:MAG: hypothetical protein K2G70_04715 [Turicibacter sp.]|nr:hypothetical protein [Turicibacter sp.]
MKKILVALIAVLFIAVSVNFLFPSVNVLTDLKKISYQQTFDQKESEYYVYFYQETCPICLQFSSELIAAHNDQRIPIYIVDAAAEENLDVWYDWEAHDEEYTKIIGKVEGGVQVFNEGESLAKYPTNEGWMIYNNADNEVVAYYKNAFNNRSPQSAEEIEVSGTPALIKVKDGQFAGYGEGMEENRALLATYGQ